MLSVQFTSYDVCFLSLGGMKVSRLKLALVSRHYPPLIGGAEKVLSYLASALVVEGAEVTVVTSRIPGLGLAAKEEQPIVSSIDAKLERRASPSYVTVERLETSKLRFLGTWRICGICGNGFGNTRSI